MPTGTNGVELVLIDDVFYVDIGFALGYFYFEPIGLESFGLFNRSSHNFNLRRQK
jgi:hypothetical protein